MMSGSENECSKSVNDINDLNEIIELIYLLQLKVLSSAVLQIIEMQLQIHPNLHQQ